MLYSTKHDKLFCAASEQGRNVDSLSTARIAGHTIKASPLKPSRATVADVRYYDAIADAKILKERRVGWQVLE